MSTPVRSTTRSDAWRHQPKPDRERLSAADLRAMLGTLRAAATTINITESILREAGAGMRGSEWDLLVTLYAYGPTRPAELARRSWLSVSSPTAHAILGRLEGRKLITRSAHPDQPRGVLVQLTDRGVEVVEQLYPLLEQKLVRPYAARYDQDELESIAELMERV